MATKYINTDLNVKGNLYLDGEAFTVNTTTVEVEDNILELNRTQGSPDAATATTSGIRIYRGDGETPADFIFDDADDTWDLTNNLNVAGTITGSLTGNASTASKWANARTITLGGDLTGNVFIDGSANVTLTAAVVDDSHNHDGRYYTETELDAGQLDNRYYTETELDGGQLDNRYYTETESDSKFFSKNQDLEFDRAATRKIIFNSDTNYNSDLAFLYFNENSSFHRTGTENVRFSIGTFNDFSNSSAHSDSLDIQGGGRLYLNVGDWDDELDTAIGTPGVNASYIDSEPIQFAINNTKVGYFSKGGNFGVDNGWVNVDNGYGISFGSGGDSPDDYLKLNDTASGYLLDLTQDSTTRFAVSGVSGNTYIQGRLGVGVTSPSSPLHVKSDAIDDVGMVLLENDYASGGTHFPALSVINTRGNHSYGIVGEFRTNTSTDSDRPSILFYGEKNAVSWQVGQITSWGPADGFGIGYRASNDPNGFTAWPTEYFTIDTSGNVDIPEGNLSISGNVSIGGTISMTGSVLQFANNDGFSYDDSTNVMSVRYDGTDYPIISSANIGSQSVSYATNAGNLDGLDSTEFEQYVNHTVDMSNTSTYAEDTYYPVTIPVSNETTIKVEVRLNSGTTPSWSTHSGGFSINLVWSTNGGGWGTVYVSRRIHKWTERWTNQTICGGITQMENSSNEVVYLRGGGKYYIYTSRQATVTPRSSSYTASNQTVSPTTSIVNKVWDATDGFGFGVKNLNVRNTITMYQSTSNAEAVYITTNSRGGGTNDADMRLGNSNNGDVMTIHNDSVGIGTTSPSGKLTVDGDGFIVDLDYNANNQISISSRGTTGGYNAFTIGQDNSTNNTGVMRFVYAGAGSTNNRIGWGFYANDDLLNLKANGNVGIGTTDPASKLEVRDSLNSTDFTGITVTNSEGGNSNLSRAGIAFKAYDWVQSAIWHGRNMGDGNEGALVLGTNPNTSDLTVGGVVGRMWIVNNGNVGIGNKDPQFELHVGGAGSRMRVGPYYTSGGDRDFVDLIADGADSKIYSNNERFHIQNDVGDIIINPSGRVGIKDTTPDYDLDVNGTIRATSYILSSSYVQADSVRATNANDAVGISFRGTHECISGEGWCTAQYAYNNNDGFLWLNRDTTAGTARPVFHIGGKNNAAYGGWAADDSIITLVRSDGTKSTGSTYSHRGLSNSAYYTNIVKTTAHTEFKDAQGVHKFNGTLRAGGDVVAYHSSDSRLKDNIKPIENAIGKVKKIGGYEFDWNDRQDTHEGHDVGVIAQEIEEVLPEVVTERDNGYKAVKYEKLVALLIQGMKEQQEQIDELKRRLDGSTK